MATTYQEGRVIEHDGVVRPEPDVPLTVEDATGTSAPEQAPLVASEMPVKRAVKPKATPAPKAKVPTKAKLAPKVKPLGRHKR